MAHMQFAARGTKHRCEHAPNRAEATLVLRLRAERCTFHGTGYAHRQSLPQMQEASRM